MTFIPLIFILYYSLNPRPFLRYHLVTFNIRKGLPWNSQKVNYPFLSWTSISILQVTHECILLFEVKNSNSALTEAKLKPIDHWLRVVHFSQCLTSVRQSIPSSQARSHDIWFLNFVCMTIGNYSKYLLA